MAKKVLITGASGLVGSRLTELLLGEGHAVVHLGRHAKAGRVPSFVWDIDKGTMDPRALEGVDTIIHLAGAGVVEKRWSAKRKKELLDSRVKSVDVLYGELKKGQHRVNTFISASAIGYYGVEKTERFFIESDPAGTDFLAHLVAVWEDASEKIAALSIRVAWLRIGIVLSSKGGALKQMADPIRMGFGSPLASGDQYLSWVHIEDLCRAFIKVADDKLMNSTFNVAGVGPATNREMTKAIARVLNKPLWLPAVPAFVLRIILGEMAYIVTTGTKVSSDKLVQAGFRFEFTDLDVALQDLYGKAHK